MHVLITTGLYPPEIGGPATYTALVERELPKHNVKVSVLPFSRSRHYPKGLRHLHFFWLVLRSAGQANVLYAQDTVSVGLPTLLASRLLGKRFIIRVPGDYAWEQSTQRYGVEDTIDDFQTKRYSLSVEILRALQRYVVNGASVVITPSNYFTALVRGWVKKPERAMTIYNGIDLSLSLPAVNKEDTFTILSAGRMVPWKGFDTLISLLVKRPEARLVLIGDGPERTTLEAMAEELGVRERVVFTGVISRDELFSWLARAHLFILNSRFESFSFQVVEAMFAGIPVAVSRVGSLPELVTDGVSGRVFTVDSMEEMQGIIASVQADFVLWQNITTKAKAEAEKFSIDATIKKLTKVILTP